ncbi:MAG: sugar-binding protein [Colwellia sp.]|nr:sugar-binding protein [Colwellia sp.]
MKLKLNIMLIISVIFCQSSMALEANKTHEQIIIDGVVDDAWSQSIWYPIDKLILGVLPKADDFSGRFKLLWDANYLYLQAEITDDILFDQHADPLSFYWDDDCLEVFIDEDNSGGNHQYNYNAFAYHVALDNQVVDIGKNNKDGSVNFVLLNDHIKSVWKRSTLSPNKVVWELAIKVFDDQFNEKKDKRAVSPVKLSKGKTLGFMLAYCDNDGSLEREAFIGSTEISPINGDKNLGYITADVFDKLTLVDIK